MPRTLTHFEIRGGGYKLPLSQCSKRGRDAATGTWCKAHMQPEALVKKEDKTPSNQWKQTQTQNSTGLSMFHDRTRSCQAPFDCLMGELETMAKPLYFLCQDVSPKVRLEVFAYNHIIYGVAMFFFNEHLLCWNKVSVLYCFVYISIPLIIAYSKYLMKKSSSAQAVFQVLYARCWSGDKQMNW